MKTQEEHAEQWDLNYMKTRNLESVLIDVLFKYNGWAISSEYLTRNTDNPITMHSDERIRAVVVGRDNRFQASYCGKPI